MQRRVTIEFHYTVLVVLVLAPILALFVVDVCHTRFEVLSEEMSEERRRLFDPFHPYPSSIITGLSSNVRMMMMSTMI